MKIKVYEHRLKVNSLAKTRKDRRMGGMKMQTG